MPHFTIHTFKMFWCSSPPEPSASVPHPLLPPPPSNNPEPVPSCNNVNVGKFTVSFKSGRSFQFLGFISATAFKIITYRQASLNSFCLINHSRKKMFEFTSARAQHFSCRHSRNKLVLKKFRDMFC